MKSFVLAIFAIALVLVGVPSVKATDGYGVVVQSVVPQVVLQPAAVQHHAVVVQQVRPVAVQQVRVQQVHPVVVQRVQVQQVHPVVVQRVRVQQAHPVVVQNVVKGHSAVVSRSVQVSRPALFRGFRR